MIHSAPTITNDDVVIFGSQSGYLYALDSHGNEFWRFNATTSINSSPVISADGTIYFGASGGNFYSIGMGVEWKDPFGEKQSDYRPCCGLWYVPLLGLACVAVVTQKKRKVW